MLAGFIAWDVIKCHGFGLFKKKIVSLRWIDIPRYKALYQLSVVAYKPLTAHYTGGGGGGGDDDDWR